MTLTPNGLHDRTITVCLPTVTLFPSQPYNHCMFTSYDGARCVSDFQCLALVVKMDQVVCEIGVCQTVG